MAVMAHRPINGLPSPYNYTGLLFTIHRAGRRGLGSAASQLLSVRRSRPFSIDDRSFPVASANVWNDNHLTSLQYLLNRVSDLDLKLTF
jgi:hypothetical protein